MAAGAGGPPRAARQPVAGAHLEDAMRCSTHARRARSASKADPPPAVPALEQGAPGRPLRGTALSLPCQKGRPFHAPAFMFARSSRPPAAALASSAAFFLASSSACQHNGAGDRERRVACLSACVCLLLVCCSVVVGGGGEGGWGCVGEAAHGGMVLSVNGGRGGKGQGGLGVTPGAPGRPTRG